ncbi:MAG TPA: NADH-quinone oxidoreductase subunit I [Mycobacteriales bacterium]|nr:NADH-quinone oxidoreductase subunit I [Mycobacteriales bacterium]
MPGGTGLLKGLSVTLGTMMRRSVTKQYPDVKPELAPRTRGVIALFEENCTVCMLCSRECPDWCIYIDSHKETVAPKEPGARARTRNLLDRFAIDFSLCMYCGICIEVCPFDALFWSPEFEYSEYDVRELTHEMDRLREWMYTVPPPPALDPDGEDPAEVVAASKAEPILVEAPALLGGEIASAGAPAISPPSAPAAVAAAQEPASPGVSDTPAGPAGGGAKREHAEIAKEDVGIDQAVFDASLAAGDPERVARAKGKSAWMKVWKKENLLHDEAPPPAPPAEAPATEAPAVEAPPATAPAVDAPPPEAPAPEAPAGETPAAEHVDVGEPQIDQATYDEAIAAGLPDRVARAKAKSAWVKKARKGQA